MKPASGSKPGIDATKKIPGEGFKRAWPPLIKMDEGREGKGGFTIQNNQLIWVASHANMGGHIMKTTIEIADDLFERAQGFARKEKTTFRALTEQGLRLVLKEKSARPAKWKWTPLVVKGGGLTDEFKNASWEKIRDEIYKGHGA